MVNYSRQLERQRRIEYLEIAQQMIRVYGMTNEKSFFETAKIFTSLSKELKERMLSYQYPQEQQEIDERMYRLLYP